MRPSHRPAAPRTAEQCLLDAVRCADPTSRIRLAREGLALPTEDREITFLLHRQRYLGHVALRRFRRAYLDATAMLEVGVMRDVAYHDAARCLTALSELTGAIAKQRLAARAAPPVRRSFHLWSLATLQHFAGKPLDALATLKRASRCSTRDRPLLAATATYIRLDSGLPARSAQRYAEALRASKNREGYGRFLSGMIAYHVGDRAAALRDLDLFLARHDDADVARAITLREELRRARLALGAMRHS